MDLSATSLHLIHIFRIDGPVSTERKTWLECRANKDIFLNPHLGTSQDVSHLRNKSGTVLYFCFNESNSVLLHLSVLDINHEKTACVCVYDIKRV